MRHVSIIGTGQIPIQQQNPARLRQMGAQAVRLALADAGIEHPDALYAANMLSDELQSQKHVAALIADEAGLAGVEALQIRAATASAAAALRVGYLAVASGAVETAVVVGVEKMSEGVATPALAKALDARQEVPTGDTLISKNAELMRAYLQTYDLPASVMDFFPVVAHDRAMNNPYALFHKPFTVGDVAHSRLISDPIRLLHCAPICDGAAAVVLAADGAAGAATHAVQILASAVATDRFRVADRTNPLALDAARLSAARAFGQTAVSRGDVSFFELHDAFSVMACLQLEAAGFAAPGAGWQLAAEGEIGLNGRLPLTTMGGLKARGHPIGATAIYQTCEIVLQLTERADRNQVANARIGMMQSVGGAGTTVLTHLFARRD